MCMRTNIHVWERELASEARYRELEVNEYVL